LRVERRKIRQDSSPTPRGHAQETRVPWARDTTHQLDLAPPPSWWPEFWWIIGLSSKTHFARQSKRLTRQVCNREGKLKGYDTVEILGE